jgi:hypothetical protein
MYSEAVNEEVTHHMRATLSLLTAAMLVVGCASIGPSIPTFPPIIFPSIPPFTIPSGLLPSGGTSGTPCTLVTAEEVGSIFGSAASFTDTTNGDCSFTFSNFSTVNVSIETGTDLSTSRILFGATAKDVTVGGLPGLTGVFIGQPAVHVQRGADELQVLGILTGSDDATIAKLVQVATLAVSRWPA